jgi:hypothetical protein
MRSPERAPITNEIREAAPRAGVTITGISTVNKPGSWAGPEPMVTARLGQTRMVTLSPRRLAKQQLRPRAGNRQPGVTRLVSA